ncbi:hypothetical protein EMIT093MI4_60086 [Pseudomonas sp. IT-93MI4]
MQRPSFPQNKSKKARSRGFKNNAFAVKVELYRCGCTTQDHGDTPLLYESISLGRKATPKKSLESSFVNNGPTPDYSTQSGYKVTEPYSSANLSFFLNKNASIGHNSIFDTQSQTIAFIPLVYQSCINPNNVNPIEHHYGIAITRSRKINISSSKKIANSLDLTFFWVKRN